MTFQELRKVYFMHSLNQLLHDVKILYNRAEEAIKEVHYDDIVKLIEEKHANVVRFYPGHVAIGGEHDTYLHISEDIFSCIDKRIEELIVYLDSIYVSIHINEEHIEETLEFENLDEEEARDIIKKFSTDFSDCLLNMKDIECKEVIEEYPVFTIPATYFNKD